MDLLAEVLLSGCVVFVVLLSLAALYGFRMFEPLAPLPAASGRKVSIVVAAKNEADTLRESLTSLAELDFPDKEVIVVCGPSTDGTESVAREFEGEVTVVLEPDRPADWLGKSWACHNGYLSSTGDVLLFTDGDVIHSPESLGVVLANLESKRADLLSVWPQIVTRTVSERVIFPASLFLLCAGVAAASSRRTSKGRRVEGANGQYIMVKREAYVAIGGHAAIRSDIMEDGAMGRRALNAGLDAMNAEGRGYLKVKPYSRFEEAWEAHERFGAGLVPSWGALVAAFLLAIAYFDLPFALLGAAVATSDVPFAIGAGIACAIIFTTQAFFSFKDSRIQYFLLAPLSGLIVATAFASGFVRFRRGGITWKDVKYGRDKFKPL